MPLQETSGNVTTDAYGGGVIDLGPKYIEDVFSTYLYTGNGSTQTITNGINLSANGGLVWIKDRVIGFNHTLIDTVRGATNLLVSNTTAAQATQANSLTAFTSTGFSLGAGSIVNYLDNPNVSWTFREQPKFFDIVTYTGTGSATTIAHNLGSVPGCIIVKRTDTTANWQVYHVGFGSPAVSAQLNLFAAPASATTVWNSTAPTSTVFSVGTSTDVNASSGTYVAYLFANNAGGFGFTGTDNVITCGTVTGAGDTTFVPIDLGYEAQWLLTKRLGATGGWNLLDNMRGWVATANNNELLNACVSNAATTGEFFGGSPSATGVNFLGNSGVDYIYIAIRRGPMKVPTDATKVFLPVAQNGDGFVTTGFPVDLSVNARTSGNDTFWIDRLRGDSQTFYNILTSNLTSVEASGAGAGLGFDDNTGYKDAGIWGAVSLIYWNFRRAPSFFDEVCYTGTGTDNRQVTHNLQTAPELIICKSRDAAWPWWVGGSVLGSTRNGIYLNTTGARQVNADAFSTNGAVFTSSYFLVSSVSAYPPNANGYKYVAYLFATCAGVSKVGSYTGNGTTQDISCGFTGGARFVLIKRTDSASAWFVYDTARGMTVLTDPYLRWNATNAQTATLGSVTTTTGGFTVNALATGAPDINANGGTYIFLAIA
jgi:hypothetical protein